MRTYLKRIYKKWSSNDLTKVDENKLMDDPDRCARHYSLYWRTSWFFAGMLILQFLFDMPAVIVLLDPSQGQPFSQITTILWQKSGFMYITYFLGIIFSEVYGKIYFLYWQQAQLRAQIHGIKNENQQEIKK